MVSEGSRDQDIVEEIPLTLWEVVELLEKRKKNKHWESTDQRRVYEYATQMAKLSKEDSEKLLKTLISQFNISRIIAVQIVNILPVTIEELEPFLKQLEKRGVKLEGEKREKFLRELLGVLREYWKRSKEVTEEEESEETNTT
ncbi:MAG: hypothetical protein ACTSX9_09750 [Candidatus Njordarchaeales archaeon]